MPGTMGRILGGFRSAINQTERRAVCHLADQPHVSAASPWRFGGRRMPVPACACLPAGYHRQGTAGEGSPRRRCCLRPQPPPPPSLPVPLSCATPPLQGFSHDLFPLYMEDDDALLRASQANWVLQPLQGERRSSGLKGAEGQRSCGVCLQAGSQHLLHA